MKKALDLGGGCEVGVVPVPDAARRQLGDGRQILLGDAEVAQALEAAEAGERLDLPAGSSGTPIAAPKRATASARERRR